MAPSFLNFKELRRRSRASFRTERSTDSSSDSASNQPTPTSGSLTPPSIAAQSDPALNLQLKDQQQQSPPATAIPRPNPHPYPNGATNRYSVSGMVGLGSPVPGGKGPSLPVSQYSPQITNVADNSWVSGCGGPLLESQGLREIGRGSNSKYMLTRTGIPKSPSRSWHHRGPVSSVSRRNPYRQPTRRQLPPYFLACQQLSLQGFGLLDARRKPPAVRVLKPETRQQRILQPHSRFTLDGSHDPARRRSAIATGYPTRKGLPGDL